MLRIGIHFANKSADYNSVLVLVYRMDNTHKSDMTKLRETPARNIGNSNNKFSIPNYSSDIIMAYVNHIRYGKKLRNKDNPQPSILVLFLWRIETKVQRLNRCGFEGNTDDNLRYSLGPREIALLLSLLLCYTS